MPFSTHPADLTHPTGLPEKRRPGVRTSVPDPVPPSPSPLPPDPFPVEPPVPPPPEPLPIDPPLPAPEPV